MSQVTKRWTLHGYAKRFGGIVVMFDTPNRRRIECPLAAFAARAGRVAWENPEDVDVVLALVPVQQQQAKGAHHAR